MWQVNFYEVPEGVHLDLWNNLEGPDGVYFNRMKAEDVPRARIALNRSEDQDFLKIGPARDRQIDRPEMDVYLSKLSSCQNSI